MKLIITGRRRPGMTLAEHRHHIRHVHGELVLRYIALDPGNAPRRYVQNPVFDGVYRATPPGADPLALQRDFVTQVWFPDLAALARSRGTHFYNEHLKDDEPRFVDNATVALLPVQEQELALRPGALPPQYKLFYFLRRAPAADAAGFARAVATLPQALESWPEGGHIRRHVRNEVTSGPAGVPAADLVEEFWFDHEAGARGVLARLLSWSRRTLVEPALSPEGSEAGLLAQEQVLHG
jgi:vanillate O-demethylase ferredoxin subunit